VTEAEPEPHESRAADDPFDGAAEAVKARDRLVKYVARYPEYADRDRDVLLLYLLDMTDHVDHELAGIKRAIDVLIKRVSR
jgi:hypothetical protein